MARKKLISDTDILSQVLSLLLTDGDKAVSFASVSTICGLAPPTLVQRYGSRDAMVKLAVLAGWDRLDATTLAASDDAFVSAKGAQAMLKDMAASVDISALVAVSLRDKDLNARASTWRSHVEAALGDRLGSGAKGREAGALMFAAWQGRLLWDTAGGKSFRLGEALRRFADQRET